jgi:PAS domain S-box-containing protein
MQKVIDERIEKNILDSNTIKLFLALAKEVRKADQNKAIGIYEKAINIFKYENYNLILGKLHNNLAIIYYEQKNYKLALDHYSKTTSCFRKCNDTVNIALSFNNIGHLYNNRQLYYLALKYYYKALEYAELSNDDFAAGWVISNIAFTYSDQGNLDSALHYLERYQKIKQKSRNIIELADSYTYFARVYEAFGKHNEALKAYKKSIELEKEVCTEPILFYKIQAIGRIYMKMGNYESAQKHLDESILLAQNDKYDQYQSKKSLFLDYAELSLLQDSLDKAKKYSIQALELTDPNHDFIFTARALEMLINISKNSNQLDSAFKYSEKLSRIKDSIIEFNRNESIYEIEVNNGLMDIEKEIDFYQKKTNLYKIIVVFAFISIISIAGLFLYRMRAKAKAHKMLVEKNSEIEEQKDELAKTNQELIKSKDRLRRLLNKHSAIMYLVDPETLKIVDANEAAQNFYGYSQAEFLNMKITDFNILDESKIRRQLDVQFSKNEGYFIFKHRLSSGEIRDVEIRAVPIEYEDDKKVFFAVVHDITQRMKAMNDLKFSEQRLQELNATKDKFFSIIAHDLKNPLGSFKQLVEAISSEYDTMRPEEMRELLGDVRDLAMHTYDLLENLLTWSRTQRGQIEYNPVRVDLSFIAYNNVSLLQIAAREKNIKILQDIPKEVYAMADTNMVTTIFRNLLSNAIKFTPENGAIRIHCDVRDKHVLIAIKDTGVGISEDNISKLFRIDVQHTTPGTNNEKGTGLGLILCHEFVTKNGGNIWVESKLGAGTEFKFTLPNLLY